jgi:hypothetical protein
VPDLQDQRVSSDAGLDASSQAELFPSVAYALLARLPFLQRFECAEALTDLDASAVPAIQAAAERELVKGVIETGLVVDLVGRKMADDVLDGPAVAMTRA